MIIERVRLQQLKVAYKAPFETSFGRSEEKDFILVSVYGDGAIGYGESVAMSHPVYNEETSGTVWYMLENFLIPKLFASDVTEPEDVSRLFAPIRRNYMAKAAIEEAVWDLHCKQQGISLASRLGGVKQTIDVGVSIGIEATVEQVLQNVERFLAEGYKKIKVKIKPGFDIQVIEAIRKRFGSDVPLMADANSAYTLEQADLLKELDSYGLMMIEQPLAHDDIIDHAKLQKQLKTPICLDESIHSAEDARKAIELGSCKIINIKLGRVGGHAESKKIHDVCERHGIPVWCGGMLEMGVGRAHNIALTSLSNFTIPGDTSASSRYWEQDIVEPSVAFIAPGMLAVPAGDGIGYEVNERNVRNYVVREAEWTSR
ncbi:o-succinylbenzoate synthase [Paenibacillus beijingensis]|uniref:o-succinylbenzoate synthase n=1 Tax=Paenibacillus beijingensis TaxID=1126833 RepID=A0A0D5NNT2_9BACL|nr:o-succinylbenzoate synthase [Paenibacillus beijingensis]AJY76979.1 O-succinylbenzoate synthase [Paenibacillus beijingensis]